METISVAWRRAITASFLIHLTLILVFGHLITGLFAQPPVFEQLIELELTSEAPYSAAFSPPLPEPLSQANPVVAVSQPTPVETQVMTAVDDMAIIAEVAQPASETIASSPPSAPLSNRLLPAPSSTAGTAKSGGISPPRLLAMVDPRYPEAARQAGIEGTVALKIQILEDGRPGSITISRSSGHTSLDDAAVAAAREWRFVPARDRDSGHNIPCYVIKPVSFRLTK